MFEYLTKVSAEVTPTQRPVHILLAEDNEVNQVLAVKILQNRGHTVVITNNGQKALAALDNEAVDIVLMDIQMPEMDGFAVTAAIREREKATGRHLPIVALTAHAMKGDRERCLDAGMDAYVSKPLRTEELYAAIDRLVPSVDAAAPVAPSAVASKASAPDPITPTVVTPTSSVLTRTVVDLTALRARIDGDGALLRKMIQLFLGQTLTLLPKIRAASERGDGKALERTSHKFKGSLGIFGAEHATMIAKRLETMGRNGTLVGAAEIVNDLEWEVASVQEVLKNCLAEGISEPKA